MTRLFNRMIPVLAGALLFVFFAGCATPMAGPLTDRELADAVTMRLQQDTVTAACRVMVMVQEGVVYLRGKAPTSNMVRGRVVSVALGTPGVVEVVDDLYPPPTGFTDEQTDTMAS